MPDTSGPGSPAFGEERRERILSIVRADGRARVRDLAALIGVTETTIRKDISELDSARLLRRIHGGALSIEEAGEPDVAARIDTNLPAKRAIARACLALIEDNDAVFFDSGTTVAELAAALADPGLALSGTRLPANVNVLTHSMPVASALASASQVRHTVLGGQYRPRGGCFVGTLALQTLEAFTVNTAFIGVTGLTRDGLTVADTAEAEVKRAAMRRARRVVVPLDASKVGVADFLRIADLSAIDVVVTDRAAVSSTELEQICAQSGIELVVAGG